MDVDNVVTGKISSEGEVVIPTSIRRLLGLDKETEISFEVKNDEIRIKKLPTAIDWKELVEQIPVEDVEIDEDGHYDQKKSPDFHDWMVNG
ncbi:AbrB/MazE/SpoVT family DNA-binding domain-containing protein [uncultured Ligilactobacillus sp.]|uniref:AbrB/MazE/SpoVT family DNA-binding domain-containing protein n=1 Tax=uncultured Ligilactobacillus sp. TaxID=2837633 RepID=UPI002729A1A9|nr:AbrB/MazE/SpoVT family DNA-binding domain-containing protein [uncultured Ligilactobacillus sp.]